jgi:alkaline phosphatase D
VSFIAVDASAGRPAAICEHRRVEGISRRGFLLGALASILAACRDSGGAAPATTTATTTAAPTDAPTTSTAPTTATATTTTTLPPAPTLSGDPFTLGVASGDPLADGVVLWTRLAPDPLHGGGMPAVDVDVVWEVTADDGGTPGAVVAKGTATASVQHAHSVHVEVTGLAPATAYRYQFRVGPYTSPVGRAKTMPPPDDADARLVIGHATCQHYETGFYGAHRDIAASDLDALVWLGDYIYEDAARPVGGEVVRSHNGPEPTELAAYRDRYALYKTDADLQAAHAAVAWFVVWDDHEVENNYAGDHSEDTSVPLDVFRLRRAAAYQAWWEHQPVRLPPPTGPDYPIYRTYPLGGLATLFLLDGRQYRTDQACGDATLDLSPACPETFAPGRTMLGEQQEQWLYDGLRASRAVWNILGNQTMLGDLTLNGAVLVYDQWDGYPAARQRLQDLIVDAGLMNVVAITGDFHVAFANDLTVADAAGRRAVATELVATSVSSTSGVPPGTGAQLIGQFPEIVYANDLKRGWVRSVITKDEWTAEYRVVDDVTAADSGSSTDAVFRILPGAPGVNRTR